MCGMRGWREEDVKYLVPGLVENLHVYGSELCAAAAPAEARVLDGLVNVHSGAIADLVPIN